MSIITDILLASFLLFIIELSCLSERPLLIALLICFNCATVSSPADNFLTRLSLYFFDKNTFFNNPNFFLGTSVFSILNLSDYFLSFCAFLYAHSNSCPIFSSIHTLRHYVGKLFSFTLRHRVVKLFFPALRHHVVKFLSVLCI